LGGLGSGRRAEKKLTAEACKTIDAADLKRMNLLRPGSSDHRGEFVWPGLGGPDSEAGYRLVVGGGEGVLWLTYQVPGHVSPTLLPVSMVTSPCHLGGRRWWFLCPQLTNGDRCGRRVRKVYLRDGEFGCRHCHRLTYMTQQHSGSNTEHARDMLDFIREIRMNRRNQKTRKVPSTS
jgi:hypothetical protein